MLTAPLDQLDNRGGFDVAAATDSIDDDLVFGHWCFACGNATDGSPYCSSECRVADSKSKLLLSPDLSPTLSAVPGLISSNKSSTSSSPSSRGVSPAALHGVDPIDDSDDEPPRLELPALANRIYSGASSLPLSIRYPSYQSHDADHRQAEVQGKSVDAAVAFEPLRYGRKPPSQIPSPLYFRQRAVHAPVSSPPVRSKKTSPTRPEQQSPMVSALHLPPARAQAPSTSDVSRSNQMRKTSSQMDSPDLLLSPRIRALRSDSVSTKEDESTDATPSKESAFASYLFAHLGPEKTTAPTRSSPDDRLLDRGRRRATVTEGSFDDKRSISADPLPHRTFSSGRPPRFLHGRGASALPSPALSRHASDDVKPEQDVPKPGQLIHATVSADSTSSSWISSAAVSADGADDESSENERGRPTVQRRISNNNGRSVEFAEPTPDPRGRSMLRGMGAVKRSMSPKTEKSRSRGRSDERPGRVSRDSTSRRRASPPTH